MKSIKKLILGFLFTGMLLVLVQTQSGMWDMVTSFVRNFSGQVKNNPIFAVTSIVGVGAFGYYMWKRYSQSLDQAIRNGHTDVVRYIITRKDKDLEGSILYKNIFLYEYLQLGYKPIHYAVLYNKSKIVDILHEYSIKKTNSHSCYIDEKDKTGKTPLYLAIEMKHTQLAIKLIKLGADCLQADNLGITPLHIAAEKGLLSVVEELLEKDADSNVQDKACATPLFYAVAGGHKEIVEKLIPLSRDLNVQNLKKDTVFTIVQRKLSRLEKKNTNKNLLSRRDKETAILEMLNKAVAERSYNYN